MKRALFLAAALVVSSCGIGVSSVHGVREQQRNAAEQAAQRVSFAAGNAEQDNILRRSQLVAQPDLVGYVVLLNFGQPVAYYTVRGKITSSTKRLETGQDAHCNANDGVPCGTITDAPSYDGTFGASDPYVYFWTTQGQYVQWSGDYLYSDAPLELSGRTAAIIAPPVAPHVASR